MEMQIIDLSLQGIDLSIAPDIYRTNNPEYQDKNLCIDFMPESIPTVVGFRNLLDIKEYLIPLFGREQCLKWFPGGLAEKQPNGKIQYIKF
jgi:hypothetical protein